PSVVVLCNGGRYKGQPHSPRTPATARPCPRIPGTNATTGDKCKRVATHRAPDGPHHSASSNAEPPARLQRVLVLCNAPRYKGQPHRPVPWKLPRDGAPPSLGSFPRAGTLPSLASSTKKVGSALL